MQQNIETQLDWSQKHQYHASVYYPRRPERGLENDPLLSFAE